MNITLSNKIGSDCQETMSTDEFSRSYDGNNVCETGDSQENEGFITVQKFKNAVKETIGRSKRG